MSQWNIFSLCLMDKAKQEQAIEYKDICEMFLSVLATAENIVGLPIDEKKYAYYDEYNSSKYKTYNGLMLQLLRIMKHTKESIEIYAKKYKSFEFPEGINPNIVKNEITYWKRLSKDNYFHLYLDDIINIIMGKPQLNLEEYKAQYYSNKPITDIKKIERLNKIIKVKCNNTEEDKKVVEKMEKEGQFKFRPVYHALPGRFDDGKNDFIDDGNADNIC